MTKPNYVQIADRFLYYAELCREQATQAFVLPERRARLQVHAKLWELDAERVLIGGALVATSRALLASTARPPSEPRSPTLPPVGVGG